MKTIFKIAIRNILKNRNRSIILGITIFISSLLLLCSNFFMNGVKTQVFEGYINLQASDVLLMWEDVKAISTDNPGRFTDLLKSPSFNIDKDEENKQAIRRLNAFLSGKREKIRYDFKILRRNAKMFFQNKQETFIIYGLTKANSDLIVNTGTLKAVKGEFLSSKEYGVCISQEWAKKMKVTLDDWVSLEVVTPYGAQNALDFQVTGIYSNRAGYDNYYAFVHDATARELFDFDDEYFDFYKIYLKDRSESNAFAREMDTYLTEESQVLRAESYIEASEFYMTTSDSVKIYFSIFIAFLIVIIAIGLQATIRMNLFERIKEFGTIRAIGYSVASSYGIVFFEIFFLSLISMMIALVMAIIYALILGNVGIPLGTGPQTYGFGGEYVYPEMNIIDIFSTLLTVFGLSLISTIRPGLMICYQNISNLLVKRIRKVKILKKMFAFGRRI